MLVFKEFAKLHLDLHQKKEFRLKFNSERMVKLAMELLIQLIQPYPLINARTFRTYNYIEKIEF